jgi:hypothetical protein
MAALGLLVGTLGVGDQLEVADSPPQLGWVKAAGRLDQDRFGLGGELVGEVVGAVGHHGGMATESSPSVRAWAVWGRGSRNRARAVRTLLWAALAPIRSRARSQPAVEPTWTPSSAPAAPPASTAASSASQWPSRRSTSRRSPGPVRPGRVREPVQVLVGQLLDHRGQGH